MKIISRGIPPKEKKYRGTCFKCNTVLEAVQSELKMRYAEHHPGEFGSSEFGESSCPVCNYHPVNFLEVRTR